MRVLILFCSLALYISTTNYYQRVTYNNYVSGSGNNYHELVLINNNAAQEPTYVDGRVSILRNNFDNQIDIVSNPKNQYNSRFKTLIPRKDGSIQNKFTLYYEVTPTCLDSKFKLNAKMRIYDCLSDAQADTNAPNIVIISSDGTVASDYNINRLDGNVGTEAVSSYIKFPDNSSFINYCSE